MKELERQMDEMAELEKLFEKVLKEMKELNEEYEKKIRPFIEASEAEKNTDNKEKQCIC